MASIIFLVPSVQPSRLFYLMHSETTLFPRLVVKITAALTFKKTIKKPRTQIMHEFRGWCFLSFKHGRHYMNSKTGYAIDSIEHVKGLTSCDSCATQTTEKGVCLQARKLTRRSFLSSWPTARNCEFSTRSKSVLFFSYRKRLTHLVWNAKVCCLPGFT